MQWCDRVHSGTWTESFSKVITKCVVCKTQLSVPCWTGTESKWEALSDHNPRCGTSSDAKEKTEYFHRDKDHEWWVLQKMKTLRSLNLCGNLTSVKTILHAVTDLEDLFHILHPDWACVLDRAYNSHMSTEQVLKAVANWEVCSFHLSK